MTGISIPSLDDVRGAQARIKGLAVETPLIRLQADGRADIYLKLENLQPVGSFKIRCAANAIIRRGTRGGVKTASAGNFAQGLAFAGQALGIPVTTYVPETAAASKIEALRRLGADIVAVPYAQWWSFLTDPPKDPAFIHPAADPDVLAGNGTIGLEILNALPNVKRVLTPWGGGGLSLGIAAALSGAGADARLVPCETDAGTPLGAALAAGAPVTVDFNSRTFITGMGGPSVLPMIWPIVRSLVSTTLTASVAGTADAVRLLANRHHVIAEGAGAAPVAAALAHEPEGPTVCVVSGGHLDTDHLVTILNGGVP